MWPFKKEPKYNTGVGPTSDGVPLRIGRDDLTLPAPPRTSGPIVTDTDITTRYRKA